MTLADLNRSEEELAPLIAQAQKLSELWLDFVKQDSETYDYDVIDYGEKTRSAGIHASEMSDCERRLVYSILGYGRQVAAASVDANMKLKFRTGTALHAMIQTDFKRMAEWYTKQYKEQGYALTFDSELRIGKDLQRVAEEWGLSSSCDGAFTFWRFDGQTWVPYLRVGLEIKTTSAPEYERRRKPDYKHMQQTCLYQACLNLPLMWLLYYNKSNSNFTTPYAPWLFKFDRHMWEAELEMKFAKAHHKAETKQLPDRTEGKHCSWCPFAWDCLPKTLNKPAFNPTPVISPGMLARRP